MKSWRMIVAAAVLSMAAWAQNQQKALVVILIGPPASGKSTQAHMLERKYRLPLIADEQLRQDARAAKADLIEGMNQALVARLSKLDLSRGFILDGYPETLSQAEFLNGVLKQKNLPQPLVVQIDVKDSVARERAQKQKVDMKAFESMLKEYQEELSTARATYPQADIWTINGEKTPQEVQETIRSLISERQQ